MDVEEVVWQEVARLQREALREAPESEYREGFIDALGLVLGWLEDEYEIEAASD